MSSNAGPRSRSKKKTTVLQADLGIGMKTERLGARAASGGGVFEIMHSAFMAGPDQAFLQCHECSHKEHILPHHLKFPLWWKLIGDQSYRKHPRAP